MRQFRILLFIVPAFLISSLTQAQTPTWYQLPDAPVETGSRFEDVYFINELTGWIVTRPGKVYRTDDGGNSWQLLYQRNPGQVLFRCLTFRDSLNGWIGDITSETNADGAVFYRTTDGGRNWNPVTLPSPVPKGMCGMFNLNDQFIFGVGRWYSDATFIKSTDGGETWTTKNLTSQINGLVDVYFFNPDTGIAIGSIQQNGMRGVIIKTTDGGENWAVKHITSETGISCWKQSYPDINTGYVSFQQFRNTVMVMKTTDGGETWAELKYNIGSSASVQGILFLDSENGWISGYDSTPQTYRTTNGGITWFPDQFGKRINRFRMLSDSLGFAAGETIYKYSGEPTASRIDGVLSGPEFYLLSSYPNPFNPEVNLLFNLTEVSDVTLSIYNITGELLAVLFSGELGTGNHNFKWNAEKFSSGTYIGTLNVNGKLSQTKLLLLK